MKNIFTLFFILLLTNIVKANDVIQINENQYFIDNSKKLVVINMDVATINSTWPNSKTHIFLNEKCEFLTPIDSLEIGTPYTIFIPSQNSNFALYFSELPIISITTNYTIVDDPCVLAYFKMIETNQNVVESNIGIQNRGAFSQSWPKKPMEIEFWKDQTGTETVDYSLLGMVKNDAWNLQAMYNEPLRIRSKTNNELWRMINQLHYQAKEPDAINGIRMKYVELFLNNEYRGLYCIGEKVSRKQLKLKKHNGSIRGELYKGITWGASTFSYAIDYDNNSLIWSGFEYKHPDEEINWANIHGLVSFVVNSTNKVFFDDYKNRFELDNLVDYYIFINLLRATDNTGKNLYIAKYDSNTKYFYVPWDLDGSFGTIYDGTNVNITNDILTNGFYGRLIYDFSPNGFREKLETKWLALRSGVIKHDFLMSLFTSNHDYLKNNGVYERENLAWTNYTYNNTNLDYMSDWITNRLAYLDKIFTKGISSTAGGLAKAITDAGLKSAAVTNLTITGEIDARDFVTINCTMPMLEVLDLSGSTIVEYIGDGTVSNLSGTYPSNEIPESAFYSKKSLTSIILPSSLLSIGESAFSQCKGITTIAIPNNVTSIGSSAFSGCVAIKTVTIGSSLKSIGEKALLFSEIDGDISSVFSEFSVHPCNSNYCSEDGVLFDKDLTTLIQFPGAKSGTYTIPNTVTKIESAAFEYCTGLTSINIPINVRSIGSHSFAGCKSLTTIYSYSKTPINLSTNECVFEEVNCTACKLYVPIGSGDAYLQADQWKNFGANIEASLSTSGFDKAAMENTSTYLNHESNILHIKGLNSKSSISLTDLYGRTLLQKQILINETVSINLLPKGVYVLRISNTEGVIERKIVKQ